MKPNKFCTECGRKLDIEIKPALEDGSEIVWGYCPMRRSLSGFLFKSYEERDRHDLILIEKRPRRGKFDPVTGAPNA